MKKHYTAPVAQILMLTPAEELTGSPEESFSGPLTMQEIVTEW